MKRRPKSRLALIALFSVVAIAPAATIDLKEVLSRAEHSRLIAEAEIALSIARQEAELAAQIGDLSASLQPNVSVSTLAGGPFADEVRISGSASMSVPVALTEAGKDSFARALGSVEDNERELAAACEAAAYELVVLYLDAWLAQAERDLLRTELDVARQLVEANEQLFASGIISLSALSASRDEVAAIEMAVLENSRDVRIRWLELAYAANLEISLVTPPLVAPGIELGELPQPPELTAGAIAADHTVRALGERIEEVRAALAEEPRIDLLQSIRASFSAASHNVSATYNPTSEIVSGSYSFPIYTFGVTDATSGSGSNESWEIGLSVSLGYETDRTAELERELLEAELALALEELAFQQEVVALQIRQKYQQYLLADGTVEQARLGAEEARENLALVRARFDSDGATQVDVAEAEARLARAEFQLMAAEVRRDQAVLAAAVYADRLDEYLGAIELQTEGE